MEIEFKSIEELYNRVFPALYAKRVELERLGYKYIYEKDIWSYLSINVFPYEVGLSLADIVDFILNTDNDVFISKYYY